MYSGTLTRAYGARLATLLGTASFLTMGNAIDAHAQGEVAQADEIPETVLITGSLIRGTTAVGVPVTNLSPMDFAQTGALTTADLFRTFPAAMPLRSLDRVFYRGDLRPLRAFAGHTGVARQASDHLPVIVEFEFTRK